MTEYAWNDPQSRRFQEQLDADPPILVYVIDVGVERPTNFRLHSPELSSEYVVPGQSVEVRVAMDTNQANETTAQVDLLIENQDESLPIIKDGVPEYPSLKRRSRRDVTLSADAAAFETFVVRGLRPGTNHGQLVLSSADGLEADNRRYFTIEVIEPWRVLVSGSPDAAQHLFTAAIAPPSGTETKTSFFECEAVSEEQLPATDLSSFAAVALLDPTAMSEPTWRDLLKYVSSGGGLVIFLGREASPRQSFHRGPAAELLPGRLQRRWRAGLGGVRLRLQQSTHPALALLLSRDSSIPWNDFPVFQHWELSDLRSDANVLMRYSNGLPALLEHSVGKGQVFTLTTPVTDALNVDGREPWNRIPTGPAPWPYLVMVNELFRYLAQSGESRLNYEVGETAILRVGQQDEAARVGVFTPHDEWWRDMSAQGGLLSLRSTDTPGTYRIRRTKTGQPQRGLSVNLAPAATQLARVNQGRLDELIGEERYHIARDKNQINRSVGEARRGREFFPWIMLLLAVMLSLESVLSNLFYANADAAEPK